MYSVSAQVNDVALAKIPLQTPSFDLDVPAILKAMDEDKSIKLAYLCSPGNPTGKLLKKEDVQKILEHPWNGVVVVDEAYIDFSPDGTSLAEWVAEWPNLVVMQTLSKAFGLAGIRLGAAFADPAIAQILNNMKAPYNIPNPTSQLARAALSPKHLQVMTRNKDLIVKQRNRLIEELPKIPGIGQLHGGVESNFLLYQILDAPADQGGKPSNETGLAVYEGLAEEMRADEYEVTCLRKDGKPILVRSVAAAGHCPGGAAQRDAGDGCLQLAGAIHTPGPGRVAAPRPTVVADPPS